MFKGHGKKQFHESKNLKCTKRVQKISQHILSLTKIIVL